MLLSHSDLYAEWRQGTACLLSLGMSLLWLKNDQGSGENSPQATNELVEVILVTNFINTQLRVQ